MNELLSPLPADQERRGAAQIARKGWWISGVLIPALIFLVLPCSLLVIAQESKQMQIVVVAMGLASILLSFIVLRMLLSLLLPFRPISLLFTFVFSTYYVALYLLLGFWLYVGEKFDPYFALDSADQAMDVAANFIGNGRTLLLIAATLIAWIAFAAIGHRMHAYFYLAFFAPLPHKVFSTLALLFCFTFLAPSHLWAFGSMTSTQTTERARAVTMTILPDNSMYAAENGESVFILQVDSQNALALNGMLEVDGRRYEGKFMPAEEKVAQDGILFPFFWANTMQTIRAQETLLCGVANNLGKAHAYDPQGVDNMCLPEILQKHGYETIMFRSDELEISNTKNFMLSIGFDAVLLEEIMKDGDPQYHYGYDDCVFYQRAFEYLTQQRKDPSKKLFVLFEVSGNHAAFAPRGQTFAHAFTPAKNFVEQYINSALEQDYCIGEFYKHFQQYTGGNAHLIITSDTSWPLGVNGSTFNEIGAHTDDFAIPVVYIPPLQRKGEFRTGERVHQRFSQTDFIPTIMELLSGKHHANSFVPFMRKDAKLTLNQDSYSGPEGEQYEDCHLLVQPYSGGKIVIVKGDDYYLYQLDTQTLLYYNLQEDFLTLHPTVIGENLPYDVFMEEYLCARYRKA